MRIPFRRTLPVFLIVIGVILALMPALSMVQAAATPDTAPKLTVSKVGTASGGVVYFTIGVTNAANVDTKDTLSDPVQIVDPLPDGATWYLLGAAEGCSLASGDLLCSVPPLQGRHLNEAQDDFVYGSFTVTIFGLPSKCGPIVNTAAFYGADITGALTATGVAEGIACPTPTPTATAIPPTATPVPPTATPVPPTSTAVPPTAVPTIVRPAPLPPNTGNAMYASDSPIYASPYMILLSVFLTGSGLLVFYHQRRN